MVGTASADPIKIWQKDVAFVPLKNDYVELLSVQQLSALDDRFGGFSGLLRYKEQLIAVTDRGQLFRFMGDAFNAAEVFPLKNENGKVLEGKKKTDSESLALSADGQILISFERKHRVIPYDSAGNRVAKKLQLPKEVKRLSDNGGLEAVETLSDGRLVLLAEAKDNETTFPMWLQDGKDWFKSEINLIDGYRPTGLARVPGSNKLVMLERFYSPLSGVRGRLSYLDAEQGKRGALIAKLGPPIPVDNFEGIVVDRTEDGQDMITLISDDNFSLLQRTLVLKLLLKK